MGHFFAPLKHNNTEDDKKDDQPSETLAKI
jgi:hypothetical protein